MIYPRDFEIKLGFDQIRERLAGYCLSSLGAKGIAKISFETDFDRIQGSHQRTWELKSIKEKGETFPLSRFEDPTPHFPTIAIDGAFIEADIFLQISNSVKIALACTEYLNKNNEVYPGLFQLCKSFSLSGAIVRQIDEKIDDTGLIKDNASSDLATIRKKLKSEQNRVRKLIDHLFREAVGNGFVPEGSVPVIRQGRVVVPVLAEHKRRISGVIMDESATGQTVFIEPTEVLEANNDIRNLELEERRECVRILKLLTSVLRENLNDLNSAFDFLAQLDVIQSKAVLARALRCEYPKFVAQPALIWNDARHPLLFLGDRDKPVVPLTIDLTDDNRFLLVSGPNAGGKSVCLKTVGLLQYMWQCGIMIPVSESSTVGVFKDIFLDIGDQQSIENDLSTYSSHLKNMRFFIERASRQTLVLMDELGAGTDPNFGGGIAEAVLYALLERKVWGVATTHYYNLKLFAERHAGIRNAAMLFDSKKLEPQFRLEIGKPGSSFALEIARKIGLSKEVMNRAEQNIGKDLTGLESLIKKVNDESQRLILKEKELRQKEIRYSELLNKYKQLNSELEGKQKLIINKAKQEAALLLQQTNKEIEKTIRHIKENKAEKKETRKVREGLQNLKNRIKDNEPEQEMVSNDPLRAGDFVKIEGQDVVGRIVSIKGTTALVEFGDMRSSVKLNRLVKSSAKESKSYSSSLRSMGLDMVVKQSTFNPSLDVRGRRADEVVTVVDQFLDDAILLGQAELRILHGKGEGVLRKIVRDHLQRHKSVASFGDEHVERGGDGITVIVLK